MNLEEYAPLALRTAGTFPNKHLAIAYWTLGIVGEMNELEEAYSYAKPTLKEAGDTLWYVVALAHEIDIKLSEQRIMQLVGADGIASSITVAQLAEAIKKHIGHGHALNVDYVRGSLHAIAATCFFYAMKDDHTAEEVMQANIDKLRRRYPEGFSHEASKNRPADDDGPRAYGNH